MHTGHSPNCQRLVSFPNVFNRQPPPLNILSPEFVPRGQMVATQQYADTSSGRHIFGSGNLRSVATLNSTTSHAVSSHNVAADEFIYAEGGDSLCSEYLPEQFAYVAVSQRRQSLPWLSSAQHHRDASTQTIKADTVDACIGSSLVLVMDASTNTPQYDEAVGIQHTQVSSESACVGLRSSVSTSPSDRWADCWQSPAGSVDNEKKSSYCFSDASKNLTTSSAMNFTASAAARRESSGCHDEELCDTGTKSHQEHSICECSFSNCPFASATLSSGVQRNVVPEQSTDASSSLLASGQDHRHESMQVTLCDSL